jgi:glyoxylase-like metal-dependent hydrolase (beta-lactamase superfamily II)/rhodanese-related sulfurtransferase
MHVVTIDLPELGNRCHLVHDGATALVVDPPRDLGAVERAAAEAEVDIAAVADTHVHNDYVSGALALARRHGADYLLAADEAVDFERVGVRDGDLLDVGHLRVRVLGTPGHTRHHQSFLVTPESPADAHAGAVFSGGSLLHGTVGRTDLLGAPLTRELARSQWASARALGALDAALELYPTHGFGSFCASTTVDTGDGGSAPTIGVQRETNPALLLDQEAFVDQLVAGFGPVPAYYDHMAPLNRAGAGRRTPLPAQPLSHDDVADAIADGAWVVDLRGRARYADGHVTGTVSVEYGAQFATYVGWLVPWHHQLVLLTDTIPDLAPALRDLAGIGIDGVGTHVLDPAQPLEATYRRADWADFRAAAPTCDGSRVVVDVRQRDEFEAGHLPDAVHLPVQDVEERLAGLPSGELWVHCRSGYRAGIASSLLHRAGRSVVHVDDDWERVSELAIPTTGGLAA